jgi:hypothetical protein
MSQAPRYVPAKTNEGWPVVGLITLLTAALIVAVVIIHNKTYRHPTDPVSPGRASGNAATH